MDEQTQIRVGYCQGKAARFLSHGLELTWNGHTVQRRLKQCDYAFGNTVLLLHNRIKAGMEKATFS